MQLLCRKIQKLILSLGFYYLYTYLLYWDSVLITSISCYLYTCLLYWDSVLITSISCYLYTYLLYWDSVLITSISCFIRVQNESMCDMTASSSAIDTPWPCVSKADVPFLGDTNKLLPRDLSLVPGFDLKQRVKCIVLFTTRTCDQL